MISAAAVSGALIVLGAILIALGTQPRIPATQQSTGLWKTVAQRWERLSTTVRLWIAVTLFAAVLTAALTKILLTLLLVPALCLGVPYLLSAPPAREIELLAALDRWVRALSTSIGTGKSIRDAIFSTRAQAPAVIKAEVDTLCARLDQRWTTREALLAFADDLASADTDAVVAALAIATSRGGVGTQATLGALTSTIQDRLRALREVETERAKPRTVVRQVTGITLAVLIGAVVFNARFFEPYRTPTGQLIALALAVAYAGCLLVLRRKSTPDPAPRFLKAT